MCHLHDPSITWCSGADVDAYHARLSARAERIDQWPAAEGDRAPTDCFKVGADYWIWQPGFGGIHVRGDRPEVTAHRSPDVAPAAFESLVTRSWLPAVCPAWGRQVLHASAAARLDTGDVVALVGPSGAGKSTLAYGLGRRSRWTQIADDVLAFSTTEGAVRLHPLWNVSRLRTASAAHFGHPSTSRPIPWPAGRLRLACLCLLDGRETPVAPGVRRLPATEALRCLLAQAHAFTLNIPRLNQALLCDYLTLASDVPSFRLPYWKSFDAIDQVLDELEHLVSLAQPAPLEECLDRPPGRRPSTP